MKCRQLLFMVLCVVIVAFANGIVAEASAVKEEPLATLYSASDFQNSDGHAQGTKQLEKIINKIYASEINEITEAFICGDYYYAEEFSAKESGKGIKSIYKVLNKQWGLEYDDIFFVQGNHDPADTVGMDDTGATDREYYSVYQINHDDFMRSNVVGVNQESQIANTAENLRSWLSEKANAGDTRPLFVISHLPLHHTYRYDNPYAEYIFNVLNEAGAKGLNIVYLFGHNHSSEYDKYIGGGAIYLSKGDEIILPDIQGENSEDFKSEIMNFTYMNAGYIGEATDGILSSCIFKIYEDKIEVQRYTEDGIYDLKAAGKSSERDRGWEENADIKKSPQEISLNQVVISWEESEDTQKIVTDVNETAVLKVNIENPEQYKITWNCNNSEIAEVSAMQADALKCEISGKKYGTAEVEVSVWDLSDQENRVATLKKQVLVAPENAVTLSYGETVRFYGLVDKMSTELELHEERDYIISNSDKRGAVNVFASQPDEYVGVLEQQAIYVPGVGTVLAENMEKNILWRFQETEGVLNDVKEYQLQISPKSLYRYKYYVAATSGIDSGLGYPNLTNMRTCSKDTSAGAAIFRFDLTQGDSERLLTTHHYKDEFKENENGAFIFTYDEINNQFVLSNQVENRPIYFYGRVTEVIQDVVMWSEAEGGKASVKADAGKETGGTIFVMHKGVIEEIPITMEMLSGYEEGASGKYICSLSFNGQVISENYELELRNDWIMRIMQWILELFD